MKMSPVVSKLMICAALVVAGTGAVALWQQSAVAGSSAPPMPEIPAASSSQPPAQAETPAAAPAAATPPATVESNAQVYFTPHKALYEMRMVAVSSGAGVTDIRGNMLFEQDDACDAWTTDHRFTIEYFYPERPSAVNSTHYVSWEAKDQSQFQFSSERLENGTPAEQLRGSVTRGADGAATAEFTRPEDLYFELPKGYVLPSFHTGEIIRAAREGRKTYHAVLFDGTDKEGPVEVNAIVTRKLTPAEIDKALPAQRDDKKFDRNLLNGDAWLVRMAVFPAVDDQSMAPTYEMDLALHDNGVVSHVLVDYKSFKIEQKLTAIEPLAKKSCP